MEPARIALLPVRRQSSRAISGVTCSLDDRPIRRKVSLTLRSDKTLRKGDCPRFTARACLSASSNTGSPVVFVKSARSCLFQSAVRQALTGGKGSRQPEPQRREPQPESEFSKTFFRQPEEPLQPLLRQKVFA